MPYTVPVSFDQFHDNIAVSGDHHKTATARKDAIVSLLSNSLEVIEAFPTGSIPRFTAVTGHADLDVVVALHYTKHIKGKTPSQVLELVRDALGEYRTNVRKNGQAVTLYYKTWPNVDIVPVSRSVNDQKEVTHYEVPDLNTEGWIISKPKRHSRIMSEKNDSCGPEFKRIVKMIKWWNHQHSSLLQSYHIEVMAIETFSRELGDYSWDVFQYFDNAIKLVNSDLSYEGSLVDEYLDYSARQEVLNRLETAHDKAREAWYLTHGERSEHENAITIWRQIFGQQFPAYGS